MYVESYVHILYCTVLTQSERISEHCVHFVEPDQKESEGGREGGEQGMREGERERGKEGGGGEGKGREGKKV